MVLLCHYGQPTSKYRVFCRCPDKKRCSFLMMSAISKWCKCHRRCQLSLNDDFVNISMLVFLKNNCIPIHVCTCFKGYLEATQSSRKFTMEAY
jgi:hypothetical protein